MCPALRGLSVGCHTRSTARHPIDGTASNAAVDECVILSREDSVQED